MANVINNHGSSNNTSSTSTSNSVSGGGAYNNLPGSNNGADGAQFQHLRDVCNMLNSAAIAPTGERAYDYIIDMMRGLDLQDDGILMNHKIKSIETDFCNIVRDEAMLCESMEYINEKALSDGETALKFAMLFSSRNFDALAMKETKVRSAMLKILETNFLNADAYRVHDKNRLYNSITLLGEYYHRVRLADNSPITILGESLLTLLIRELSEGCDIDARLAKLVLSQITLNGDIMRTRHKVDVTQLLFHIRRNLIEQPALKSAVKALLLMTLDLFYSNFTNLGTQLEEMYTKYLIQGEEDEDNNNIQAQIQSQADGQQSQALLLQQQQPTATQNYTNSSTAQPHTSPQLQQQLSNSHSSFENGLASNIANDSFEIKPSTKKWSEQVCEDSFCDGEFLDPFNHEDDVLNKSGESAETNTADQTKSSPLGNERNSRRAFQPRRSPRPLKQHYNNKDSNETYQGEGEDRDETKPLPRWRAPRFNSRDNGDQYNGRGRNDQRRFSASFDDDIDHHSVRSEGGNGSSLRLYSINDRMKHSHERFERSTGGPSSGNFNNIVNSNWDRQSQRDDRSERSYISNYERGNYKRGSGRYNNNRNTYDKPPRFQKNHYQQKHNNGNLEQQKIHSDSWRRSNTNVNNAQFDDNCSYNSNGQESQSRSSSRARTLPRPAKSSMDGSNRQGNSYRHTSNHAGSGDGSQPHQQQQRYSRNYNARYSSQSSLASETSSTLDRRNQHNPHYHQRHRNFSRRSRPEEQQDDHSSFHNNAPDQQQERQPTATQPQQSDSWNTKEESDLVRNAAEQTAKYINYLSSQK